MNKAKSTLCCQELLAWFTGKEPNRRKYPRKRKPYRATFSVDAGVTQKPAIGLDISGGGLCVLTQEPVGKDEFEVRATIESRVVRLRAKSVWQDTVTHQGKSVWRYGMRFTGISADDWDAIVRYTTDKSVEESNKAQEELVDGAHDAGRCQPPAALEAAGTPAADAGSAPPSGSDRKRAKPRWCNIFTRASCATKAN